MWYQKSWSYQDDSKCGLAGLSPVVEIEPEWNRTNLGEIGNSLELVRNNLYIPERQHLGPESPFQSYVPTDELRIEEVTSHGVNSGKRRVSGKKFGGHLANSHSPG